ncbi:MAG: cell division protein ZapA [Deltaproteobacteria bacterium]|nr:cell division protein ZapA [Deltaproteobacteria bacterium]
MAQYKSEQKFQSKKGDRKAVTIRVLDQELKITTDGSPDRAQKVSQYLNASVQDVLKKAPKTPQFKALVLAALNITDRYFAAAERHSRLKVEMGEKSQRILDLLEDATST